MEGGVVRIPEAGADNASYESDMKGPKEENPARPYGCIYKNCSRTFKRRFDSLTHMRSHLHLKPYTCDLCGMAFSQPGYVVSHQERKHASVPGLFGMSEELAKKNRTCKICGRLFSRPYRLRRHLQKVHQSAHLMCPFRGCGKLFMDIPSLQKHQLKYHPRAQPSQQKGEGEEEDEEEGSEEDSS
jgi:general transcription factor IIIA